MSTPGINLTIVLGHPLGLAPFVQAIIPDVVPNSPVWIVALPPSASPQSPGPQSPPVIS